MRRALLIALVAACPAAAVAHTGPTQVTSVRAGAQGPWTLGTTFGLVVREDASAPWDVICSEAIGYDEKNTPVVHRTAGALFVGSIKGLFVSRDGGCAWEAVPGFSATGVTSVTSDPTAPMRVLATTGRYGAANGLFESTNGGDTFPTVLHQQADTFYSAARFAPSDPQRLWVSAWYFSPPGAWLFRSDDGGQAFTTVTPSLPFVSGFTIIAVHPGDPDTLLASAFDDQENEYVLLSSGDGGATFSEVARDPREFREAAFSPDGTSAWAAGERLYASDDGGASFALVPEVESAYCAAWVDGALYFCGSESLDGFSLARGAFADPEVVLRLPEVRGLLQCPEGSATFDVCEPLWTPLALALGVPLDGVDGGTGAPDGGADGGQGGGPGGGGGCGCASSGGAGTLLFLLVPLVLWGRRRAGVAALLVIALTGCPTAPPDPPPPPPVDPCAPNPCTEPGRTACEDDGGRAVCACDEGLLEVDGACVPPDPCDPNPCQAAHQSVCAASGTGVTCSCDPGYELSGSDCVPLADCGGQHLDGDAFEPDECPALARSIGTSGSQAEPHTLAPDPDADWFKVDPAAGRAYRFLVEAQGGEVEVGLFRGEALELVDPALPPGAVFDFARKAADTAPLYLRVRAAGQGESAYTLSIGDNGPDDHPDDRAGAQVQPLPLAVQGGLQFNGDVDVVAAPLLGGHAYAAEVVRSDQGPALELKVSLDAGGPPVREGGATWVFRPAVDVTGAFAVSDPSLSYGAVWSLNVADLGPDDHADVPKEATPLGTCSPPGPLFSLERDGDADAFTVTLSAGRVYRFRCAPASLADCLMEVSDPSGAPWLFDVNGGAAELTAEPAAGGEYGIRISSVPGGTGSYRLCVEDLGPDDHGDDPGAATDLGMPVGTALGTAAFETSSDHDFLKMTADPDHIYRIIATPSSGGDCNLRLFNSAFIPVAQDVDGGGALILRELNGGGDYYLELFGAGATPGGGCAWSIQDLAHDDHGDDVPFATLMSANGAWVMGEVQTFTDEDFFRFAATAGRIYRVTCQRQALPDCLFGLYDPQEQPLTEDVDGGDAVLLFEAPAAGTYSHGVRGGVGQLGTYLVKVEDLGTDDYPDGPSGALPMLADGTPSNGTLETPGDRDFRQVSLGQGTAYALSATGAPLTLTVYAADGTTVVASGTSPLQVTPVAAGLHYVEARGLGPQTLGTYSIALQP